VLSTKNYYHCIRLMGRSASHVTLECALLTQPNLAFIGEEIAAEKQTLAQLIETIADLIIARAKLGKHYGIVLIPEGMIEFVPELPKEMQAQLDLPTDSHGNVQLSTVETEKVCIRMVEEVLKKRAFTGTFKGIPHFFGYEGRSGFPTNFDCTYCTALGVAAAVCIASGLTGYMCSLQDLTRPPREWQTAAIPLTGLMDMALRSGKEKAVVRKGFVDLQGPAFKTFKQHRHTWALNDAYRFPGPIQFSSAVSDRVPLSLLMEAHA
jgi:pyrophosphate--fructose-6-phosphate 1-phosphotransferase